MVKAVVLSIKTIYREHSLEWVCSFQMSVTKQKCVTG